MHLLDLEKQKWIGMNQKGNVPGSGRCRHSFTALDEKQYLVIGGYAESATKEMFIFHLDDVSWTKFENAGSYYPIVRSAHKAERVGEYGLVIAGGYVNSYVEPFYYVDLGMFL